MIDLGFWFLLPIGIVISSIAMMAGIGGALLFSPFFMLVLGLDPLTAFSASLVIEMFGFSSGVIGYWRQHSINFHVVKELLIYTIPATLMGVFIGRFVPHIILTLIITGLMLYLAYRLLIIKEKCIPKHPHFTGVHKNHDHDYISLNLKASSFFGGLLLGMISAGLGEVNEFNFLKKLRLSIPLASGTSVFLVALSAIIGVFFHGLFLFKEADLSIFSSILSLIIFTVPGVIIGAQIGVRLSKRIKPRIMHKGIGLLFLLLGLITLTLIF